MNRDQPLSLPTGLLRRVGVPLLLALALAAGCGRQASGPSREVPPAPKGGPDLEVRLLRAQRVELLLPARVRIFEAETGEVLHVGEPPRDVEPSHADGGDTRSPAASSTDATPFLARRIGERLFLGSWEAPGPFEIRPFGGLSREEPDGASAGAPLLGVVIRGEGGSVRTRYFRGGFVIGKHEKLLELTSKLSLEEYLAGVVGAEMVASTTPMEALKAQAVAARTYALYGIRSAVERGKRPVFPGSQSFQVYGGVEKEHPRVAQAVEMTVGEVLTYEGGLFRAYFHSTCGGATASASAVFGEPDIEPLRGITCADCAGSTFARWSVKWPVSDLASVLRPWLEAQDIPLGALKAVEVSERLPQGRARYVKIEHERGSFELKAERLRELARGIDGVGLRSTAFEVSLEGDSITFEGAGWGHGAGLCQIGAGKMGETRGYREILAHYYPGSVVEPAYRGTGNEGEMVGAADPP